MQGELTSDLKRRVAGARVIHRVERNAVKMYDRAHRVEGSVLRIEMTMNREKVFRVFRAVKQTRKEKDKCGACAAA